jgi:Asp-tRNA(Asn)/Glu-tRNA(Gln) amidotransferase A subunit family amidase
VFLKRMGAITAAAASGAATLPTAHARTVPQRALGPVTLPDPRAIQATAIEDLTLAEAAALIRQGDLVPSDLVQAYLSRIEAYDGTYMAYNLVTNNAAQVEARALADEPNRGPLHGIPLAIKDNYFTAGVRTTANSHIFADFVPGYDATSWARLKASGAVLMGKTQMGPLATSRATTPDGENTTLNAWAPNDSTVSPGGSSSGSATAIAAGLATCSTGTQTGGSITGPSMAQGLTGLKPTMGRVSLHGIIPLTYTRDHPGPIARDAMDAAIMLQAMAGPDPLDPRTAGQPELGDLVRAATPFELRGRPHVRWGTTVGVTPGYLDVPDPPSEQDLAQMDLRQRAARLRGHDHAVASIASRREMLAKLEEGGARVVEVEMPQDWDTLTSRSFNNVRLPERSEPFLRYLKEDVRLFGVSLSPWVNGLLLSGTEYLRGQRAKMLLLERVLDQLFAQCDVVVQTEPFPFDMIGLPLIAFPIGFESQSSDVSRPVGAMLGGQPYAEDRLLAVAAAYQALTDWHLRRPEAPDGGGGQASGRGPGQERGVDPSALGSRLEIPVRRGRTDLETVMDEGQ